MKKPRIAVIGLDGANKTTAKLIGIKSQLHDFISTIPPYTPPSWTSILTGVNPAKHGIIGWQKVDKRSLKSKIATSRDVKYPRLPEVLSSANMKSVIINLPMTYPFDWADPRTTIVVSDWIAPRQSIFPKRLESKYRKYLVDPPHQWWAKSDKKEYSRKVKEFTETRLTIYYDLLEKEDWDLYFIVFSEVDWFSHWAPQILDGRETHLVKPTFRLINEFIQEVDSIADIIFIVSDHGFQQINKVFYVNEALAEKGFIKYSKLRFKLASMAKNIIRKSNILYRIIPKSKLSANAMSYALSKASVMLIESETWGIYVKDKDKTKNIITELRDYPEIIDVIPSRFVHKGPYIRSLPDLFVIPEKGVKISDEFKSKVIEPTIQGDHELRGILSVWGDGINDEITFNKTPRVYDIVPTILELLGLPISKDIDGRVLEEIFKDT